jgi:alpha-1,2-glucosyltransferase
MDEIFHVPQTRKYCNGEFDTYDEKITTLPGFYLVGSAYAKVLSIFGIADMDFSCSTNGLRLLNSHIAISFLMSLVWCRAIIIKEETSYARVLWSLSIFLFPTIFFYYFLVYTDTLSITSLVIVYAISQQEVKAGGLQTSIPPLQRIFTHLATFFGAILAIFSRQTNAVWLLFIIGTNALDLMLANGSIKEDRTLGPRQLCTFIGALLRNAPTIFAALWPLIIPVLMFVVFVYINGGVVVGDKENHAPVVHFAMPLHLVVATAFSMGPFGLFALSKDMLRHTRLYIGGGIWKALSFFGICTAVCAVTALVLYFGCLSHPFLLADNRHYTFYLWKYIFSKPEARILLAPVYAMCGAFSTWKLRERRGPLWITIFAVAAILSLVPAHLFEPRYFTPGLVLAQLNMPSTSPSASVLASCVFLMANWATIHVFISMHFEWPDGSAARFMF